MIQYENFGLTDQQAEIVHNLNDSQMQYAYHLTLRNKNIDTVKNIITCAVINNTPEARVIINNGGLSALTDEDFNQMAEIFELNHDDTQSDAEQWDMAIHVYLTKHWPKNPNRK